MGVRLLHLAVIVAAVAVAFRGLRSGTDGPPDEALVRPLPLAFLDGADRKVLQVDVRPAGEEAGGTPILTLYGDDRLDVHAPTWDADRHLPTDEERAQGFCVRKGQVFFPPDWTPRLADAEQDRLLTAIERAGLAGMAPADVEALASARTRIRARRRRAVPESWDARFRLSTNRGRTDLWVRDADRLVQQYDTAAGHVLRDVLAVRAFCVRAARAACARRLDAFHQQQLLNALLKADPAEARRAGTSLWQYGNDEIVPHVLRLFVEKSRARVVRDMGMVLSGLGRRRIGMEATRAVMRAWVSEKPIASAADRARLVCAMQWCGVFGTDAASDPLLDWFTNARRIDWKVIAPAPFVGPLLQVPQSGGQGHYALVRPARLAGAVLVRLARRGKGHERMRRRLLPLVLAEASDRGAGWTDTALKILGWSGGADTVRTLIAQAHRVLPTDSETRVDYGVLLPLVDAPHTDRLLARRLQAEPPLEAWQAAHLLGCARFPDTPVMRRLWGSLLAYEGRPPAGARRVRFLAARALWNAHDEERLARLTEILAEAVEAGVLNPYNGAAFDWGWRGAEAFRAALRRGRETHRVRMFLAWLAKQIARPQAPPAPPPEEEYMVF